MLPSIEFFFVNGAAKCARKFFLCIAYKILSAKQSVSNVFPSHIEIFNFEVQKMRLFQSKQVKSFSLSLGLLSVFQLPVIYFDFFFDSACEIFSLACFSIYLQKAAN